ncbi:MAG: ribosomal protein S18-alanine N-acetyltransferase [Deltaproteobacteria bacterium]|nr:ribosomal protein S18-alanine N-acetyltransferase [Deltaproteobacteria bacterium]
MNIRPFQPSDLDSVVRIEQLNFTIPWSGPSFLDCSQWPEFWFRVAVLDKKVVGYFVAQVVEEEAELHNIAVDPDHHRQGVGRALMNHLLEAIKKKKVRHVFLLVRPSNTAAIHLYQQFGFALLDRRPKYYADTGEDGLIFYKDLDT